MGLSPSLHQEKLAQLHQRAMFLLHCSAPSCQLVNAADRPCGSFFRAVPLLRSLGRWLQFSLIRGYRSGAGLLDCRSASPSPRRYSLNVHIVPSAVSWSPLVFSSRVLSPSSPFGRVICRVEFLPWIASTLAVWVFLVIPRHINVKEFLSGTHSFNIFFSFAVSLALFLGGSTSRRP